MRSFDAVIDARFGRAGMRADARSVREIVYLSDDVERAEPQTPLARVHPGEGFYRNVKRWLLAHEGVSIA